MKRLADQLVGDVRPVELRGVDVVDAEFDGAAQDGERLRAVARRAEHARTGELHGAEADTSDLAAGERAHAAAPGTTRSHQAASWASSSASKWE